MNQLQNVQLEQHYTPGSHWVVTANHGYIAYAQEELRRRFGQLKSRILLSGEVALMELPVSHDDVWSWMRNEPTIFVRHLQPVQATFVDKNAAQQAEPADVDGGAEVEAALWQTTELLECLNTVMAAREWTLEGKSIAVHVRRSGAGSDERQLRDATVQAIEQLNGTHNLQAAELVVSLYIHDGVVYAGLSTPEENGSDWSGGAMRFQREDGQISRAKFKLLEAEKTFGLDFSAYHTALDIGAAPGGWTSLLLERGVFVTAVDPAKMHPSLMDHPNLQYYGKNAADVAFESNEFDLLVCDMSWSPKVTAQLVYQLLDAVKPGGTVIVTLKLMHKKPLQTIRDVTEMYEQHLHILRAKQLFHNRDEITLYMMKY
ncbi:SAM-dependent methyltransferase [Paenibacillus sp. 481]|uniref:SAM-dependent methyltransferase n=1 Tax=Paenibacillus sp. 481 TaxID=2835869 RepID=UPI001E581754|nr:SAM-dependent methyltransferase [Paenibacillus sp. 481]UHA73101.1 methyltransferase domain-containing protein [Paenibacillus sp. 481]